MEPISTAAMVAGIVGYLGGQLAKDKSISGFISEFTAATVNWIKPIFLREDGSEKDIIKNLKAKPESDARKKAVESALEIGIEDNPEAKKYVKEIFEQISKTEEGGKIVNNIINSKNVVTGNINAGGSVTIGDNNYK